MHENKPPRVSIVMPVRNVNAWLPETLISIQAQTFTDFELLAINDHSEDDTLPILNAAAAKDGRIKILQNQQRGLIPALNTGMASARGEFIARMDGDDFMPSTRLAAQSEYLQQNPEITLVTGHVEHWGDAELTAGYSRYVDFINSLRTPADYELRQFIESPLAHPSVMLRRAHLPEAPYRDRSTLLTASCDFPEDYDLWLRLLADGRKFAGIPETVLKWRDYPTRTSRTDPRYDIENFYRHKAAFIAAWLSKHGLRTVRVWSGGRRSRRRIDALRDAGIEISAFIDVHPRRVGQTIAGTRVIHPDTLKTEREGFILVYVGSRGVRETVGQWLAENCFNEGEHFLFAA